MSKLPKIKPTYFLIGLIVLLVANYHSFDVAFSEDTRVETTDEMVAKVLFKNGIQVVSVPGVYNVKDISKIDISLNKEMHEKVEVYDQILYYKSEGILVLYRPSTRSVVAATTVVK
jgi:hypothetical protein